jgi:hypothetical protein
MELLKKTNQNLGAAEKKLRLYALASHSVQSYFAGKTKIKC